MRHEHGKIHAIAVALLLGIGSAALAAQPHGKQRKNPGEQPGQSAQQPDVRHHWAIVLHGGAGVIERSSMTPQADAQYRAGLKQAITVGGTVLDRGGTAVDAVEAAIRILEDNPLFNAGRGSVFAADGTIQMDAAIMDGATMRAGAVADVQHTKNPISLARAVMEKSPYVLLIGDGADAFSRQVGLQQEPQSYFFTERRWDSFVKQLQKENLPVPPRPQGAPPPPAKPLAFFETPENHKYGTVGMVALDQHGNIAAGTSTGGIQAKRWSRVGDSPLIGAGTYASNQSCAVSATGTGEYFIRLTVARTICALVQYKRISLQAAVDEVVQHQLPAMHGDGGVIAITPDGQLAWSFNTPGMFRARLQQGGKPQIGVYRDEP
ncbi:MAG TPA: isoaspartyl peptidase/L-asparaginase [Acidobacteriaceae bacterium]|nr:isoaspartyl peptidase/L-asparaginase [Acidobacteriaceae bacterium]